MQILYDGSGKIINRMHIKLFPINNDFDSSNKVTTNVNLGSYYNAEDKYDISDLYNEDLFFYLNAQVEAHTMSTAEFEDICEMLRALHNSPSVKISTDFSNALAHKISDEFSYHKDGISPTLKIDKYVSSEASASSNLFSRFQFKEVTNPSDNNASIFEPFMLGNKFVTNIDVNSLTFDVSSFVSNENPDATIWLITGGNRVYHFDPSSFNLSEYVKFTYANSDMTAVDVKYNDKNFSDAINSMVSLESTTYKDTTEFSSFTKDFKAKKLLPAAGIFDNLTYTFNTSLLDSYYSDIQGKKIFINNSKFDSPTQTVAILPELVLNSDKSKTFDYRYFDYGSFLTLDDFRDAFISSTIVNFNDIDRWLFGDGTNPYLTISVSDTSVLDWDPSTKHFDVKGTGTTDVTFELIDITSGLFTQSCTIKATIIPKITIADGILIDETIQYPNDVDSIKTLDFSTFVQSVPSGINIPASMYSQLLTITSSNNSVVNVIKDRHNSNLTFGEFCIIGAGEADITIADATDNSKCTKFKISVNPDLTFDVTSVASDVLLDASGNYVANSIIPAYEFVISSTTPNVGTLNPVDFFEVEKDTDSNFEFVAGSTSGNEIYKGQLFIIDPEKYGTYHFKINQLSPYIAGSTMIQEFDVDYKPNSMIDDANLTDISQIELTTFDIKPYIILSTGGLFNDVKDDITYTGYNPSIIDIDTNTGIITMKSVGITSLTITTNRPDVALGGNSSATINIEVTPIPVITVATPTNQSFDMIYGDTASTSGGNLFTSNPIGYEDYTIQVSGDNAVYVTKNSSGGLDINTIGVGDATITCINDYDTSKTYTVNVHVSPKITFRSNVPDMVVAENINNLYLPSVATIDPSNINIFSYLEWESDSPKVVEINADNRTFNSKKAGFTAKITAYDTTFKDTADEASHCKSFNITVSSTATLSDLADFSMYVGDVENYPICSDDMSKIKWSVDDDTIVNLTGNRLVALRSGVVTLRAEMIYDSSIYKECEISVYEPVSNITFANSGETYDVNAKVITQVPVISPATAHIQDVFWTSSNPEVADIDSDTGDITLYRDGNTIITAHALDGSGVSGSYGITVTDTETHPVVDIRTYFEGNDVSYIDVAKGETVKLDYDISPYNATNRDILVEVVSETNTDPATGEVNNAFTGDVLIHPTTLSYGDTINIEGKSEGLCKIRLKALDGSDAETIITVNVKGEIVDSIAFKESKLKLYTADEPYQTEILSKPATGTIPRLTYESSDESIATVDDDGKIKAIGVGTVKITATYDDNKGKKMTASCVVECAESVAITSISYADMTPTITTSRTGYINPISIEPANATNKKLEFTSSNSSIATVNKNTGAIVPLKDGNVTITANTTDGSKLVATYSLTIKPIYVTSIKFKDSEITVNEFEVDTVTNPVIITPEAATYKNLTYTSSNPNVATVDNKGVATIKGHGTTVITAVTTDDTGLETTYTLNVTAGKTYPVTDIKFNNTEQCLEWTDLSSNGALSYYVCLSKNTINEKSWLEAITDYFGGSYTPKLALTELETDAPYLSIDDFGFTPVEGATYYVSVAAIYKNNNVSKLASEKMSFYEVKFTPGTADYYYKQGNTLMYGSGTPSGTMKSRWGAYNTDFTLPKCGFYMKGSTFKGWSVNGGSTQNEGSTFKVLGPTTCEAEWDANGEYADEHDALSDVTFSSVASGMKSGKIILENENEKTDEEKENANKVANISSGKKNNQTVEVETKRFILPNYLEYKDVDLKNKTNHAYLASYCGKTLNNYFESNFKPTLVDMSIISPPDYYAANNAWKRGQRKCWWYSPLAYDSDTLFATWYCGDTRQLLFLPVEIDKEEGLSGLMTFNIPCVGSASVISIWKLEDEETVKFFGDDTYGIKGIAMNIAGKGLAYRQNSHMSGIDYDVNQGITPIWNSTLGVAGGGGGSSSSESESSSLGNNDLDIQNPNPNGIGQQTPTNLTVPNVVGYNVTDAKQILTQAGFTSVIEFSIVDETQPAGTVTASTPTVGQVSKDGKITLYVANSSSSGSGGYVPKSTTTNTTTTNINTTTTNTATNTP